MPARPSIQPSAPPRTGFAYLDDVIGPPRTLVAMAHRGGATHPDLDGRENTLEAFQHAVALGYRYLETDVHASSDGELFAFHDAVLDRVTDQHGPLAERAAAALALARIRGEHPIPRMGDLLEEFPDARFNIDLKADAAVEPLVRLLADHGAEERVCVGSFSARRIQQFRRLTSGRVVTAGSQPEVAAFLAPTPLPVLRRLARGPMKVLQVPWRRKDGRLTIASAPFVRRAHAAGVHVHVWTGDAPSSWATIDDEQSISRLIDTGVDGMIADRTDVLKDVLSRRGLWRG